MNEKKPIKLLFVINSLVNAGSEVLLLTICRHLLMNYGGYSISVITSLEGDDLVPEFEKLGIPVTCVHLDRHTPLRKLLLCFNLLRNLRPDIVHTHLLLSDRYFLIAAFFAGVRVRISTTHNTDPARSFQDKVTCLLTSLFATRIVSVSESVRRFCLDHRIYPKRKMMTIPNASSISRGNYRPKRFAEKSQPTRLISIGRMTAQKNQACLIQAMRLLEQTAHGGYVLDIYGVGELQDELQALIAETGSVSVRLRGIIDNAKIPEVIREHDLFVSTSIFEGFPISVLEAMSLGMPLVLSDIPPHRELFEPIGYSHLFPPSDPAELARKIGLLSSDETMYNDAAETSYRESARYTREIMMERYNSLYTMMVRRRTDVINPSSSS